MRFDRSDLRRAFFQIAIFWLVGVCAAQPPEPKPHLSCDGHTGEVYCVCYSRDGKRIASATGREIKVWDAANGHEILNYLSRGSNVYGLAFSPDGKKLAVGVSHDIRIVEIATGKDATILKCPQNFVFRISFSPDGKHVAAAGGQNGVQPGSVHVWELTTGVEVQTLAGHTAPVIAVEYSVDGRFLCSASGATSGTKSGEVCVYDRATGRLLRTLEGHTNNIYGVALSPDGRCVASGSGIRGQTTPGDVKLWELLSGKQIYALSGHSGPVYATAFSPDGRLIATGAGDKTLRIWDARLGKEIHKLNASTSIVYSVAFSPDGKYVATAGADRSVKVWHVPTPEKPAAPMPGDIDKLWSDLGTDLVRAHQAAWALVDTPSHAVPYLCQKLRPAAALSPTQQAKIAGWVRDLDSPKYPVRETAHKELAKLGEPAVGALTEAAAGNLSAEARQRVTRLLDRYRSAPYAPEELQTLRGIVILERIGNDEALALLKTLAGGLPGVRVTEEARATLERMTSRKLKP